MATHEDIGAQMLKLAQAPDGGPAFPFIVKEEQVAWMGMTLRDWFAGQALAGLLARPSLEITARSAADTTEDAYKIADAMLAYRRINHKTTPACLVPNNNG